MRHDLALIPEWIQSQSRVLDLGCGDGELLAALSQQKRVNGLGVEIDTDNINACIRRGIAVVEHNLDNGLTRFESNSFDTVVMTQALQTLRHPNLVISEMLRVGKEAIVTFPNFGHWRCRWHLGRRGRMPVSKFMPYSWYDTPNIHFCTVNDFEQLCKENGISVIKKTFIDANNRQNYFATHWPNLFAVTAIYHLSK